MTFNFRLHGTCSALSGWPNYHQHYARSRTNRTAGSEIYIDDQFIGNDPTQPARLKRLVARHHNAPRLRSSLDRESGQLARMIGAGASEGSGR
jgi:hypothetical protein